MNPEEKSKIEAKASALAGLEIRAMMMNPHAAAIVGIGVRRTSFYVMAITGGWSLGGFGRLWFTEIQSVTCVVAGVLLVRQSRPRT